MHQQLCCDFAVRQTYYSACASFCRCSRRETNFSSNERPTVNDSSSATIKTSHRTKVFTFLTLDECVDGSVVILAVRQKHNSACASFYHSTRKQNNFFVALSSKERVTVNDHSSATIKTSHRRAATRVT